MIYLFERDADLEVVWDGQAGKDELLPARDSQKDSRWDSLSMFYAELMSGFTPTDPYLSRKAIRSYTKRNQGFWANRTKLYEAIRSRRSDQPGTSSAEKSEPTRRVACSLPDDQDPPA